MLDSSLKVVGAGFASDGNSKDWITGLLVLIQNGVRHFVSQKETKPQDQHIVRRTQCCVMVTQRPTKP